MPFAPQEKRLCAAARKHCARCCARVPVRLPSRASTRRTPPPVPPRPLKTAATPAKSPASRQPWRSLVCPPPKVRLLRQRPTHPRRPPASCQCAARTGWRRAQWMPRLRSKPARPSRLGQRRLAPVEPRYIKAVGQQHHLQRGLTCGVQPLHILGQGAGVFGQHMRG
jgi:hypothetical protein